MKIEVCANSFESALAAQNGGAHRIELCEQLDVGGVTPSHSLIEKAMQDLSITSFVLIRPRAGDFIYSNSEFKTMLCDIAFAKSIGVQGIVSGVLLSDHTIDIKRTSQLVKASEGMSFTFHRAFDQVLDPVKGLEELIELGVDRVLTSGQKPDVVEGFDVLKSLREQAKERIVVLPGGGVSITNVEKFIEAGFKEVHGSFRESVIENSSGQKRINKETHTNQRTIKHLIKLIKK